MDQLVAHQRAQDAFATVLGSVGSDQVNAPTPCSEWSVRDVVAHVVGGNCRMAGVAPPEDLAPDALAASHAESARAAQAAFAAPDGLTRTIELPFASLPGKAVIGLRTTDVLTHAWDLARATGQPTDIEPELAAAALEASRARITADFRGPGKPFAEEQACDPGRPAADRLAAFLGRTVT